MGRSVASLPVFFAFFCYVQCQWNHLANREVDPIDTKGLRILNQGRSSHNDDWSPQFRPASVPIQEDSSHIRTRSVTRNTQRSRRHAKAGNAGDEPFAWNHQFTIEESQPTSLTKETAYIWQDDTKRLKHTLEKDTVFQFLNPTGLRISIPANNVNMRIIDYRVKLNDEFRGNDGGHFALNSYKNNGMMVYEVPQLKLKQGDRVYYWIRLVLSKEAFNVIVKGTLEITRGNPHITPYTEGIPFRPQAPVLNTGLSPTLGGGTREPFVWNHQFTINATYSNAFTKESASAWLQHAEFIRRFLQKHIDFKFINPSGLLISIPDDNININDFRIKLNDEFRENDAGHFQPTAYKRDNMWTYYIPQLRVQQGDRVYYWMRVKRNKDGFDAIVRGVLEINHGNPHTEPSFFSTTSVPYLYIQSPQVNTQPPRVQPPVVFQRPTVGGGQPTVGVGQPSTGVQQPSTGSGQQPAGVQLPSDIDRFGDIDDNNGAQAYKWEHKFVSINLNKTSEAGLTQDSATWAQKTDEYFKKMFERDIKFQFFNPAGLNMILSGDDENNFRILAFQVKLNEEFVNFDNGQYLANITRRSDGRWNCYFPSLRLKQGDKVYYWMRVTFGKDMWLYIVKGILEISLGDPHNNLNSIRTTTSAPQPTYVEPNLAIEGQPAKWDHKFTVNKTNSDGSSKISPEDEQLLKNMFKKDVKINFLNPSGLSISFSGEEDLRVLAFNMKLNDDFKTIGPGDYVANVTRLGDGRLNYYYPNLKVKLGDKVYYWMRVMLGKDNNDYIVKGDMRLKEGDPHIGGPVPDVPPPIIYTQAPTRPTAAPVLTTDQPPVPPNNDSPPSTQTPLPFNEPLKQATQSPYPQSQPQQIVDPLPLSINQSPLSGVPTRLCADGPRPEGSPPCQEELLVGYRFNNMDGTHQITIGAKSPIQLSVGVNRQK